MLHTSTSAELKYAIQLLEEEKALKGIMLKQQFLITYESLKPINIIKNTFNDLTTSANFTDTLLGTVMGIASGSVSKKIAIGGSTNIFRKILGSILQFGVTAVVSKHPETIKSVGEFLFTHIFPKKKTNTQDS